MNDPLAIAEVCLATWNAADDDERCKRLEGWSAEARYADPLMTGRGRDGIAAMMANACARFPDPRFALSGRPDGHGCHVRFSWTLAAPGEPPVARGTDFVMIDHEQRIADVVGFLDGEPA